MVSPPGKGPIIPGQALYKVKWSKYIFFKHLHSTIKSEDTKDVLGGLRARHNEIKAWFSRPTWQNCSLWLCNVHCWNATQYYSTETVLLIFPFLQTNITVQMKPSDYKQYSCQSKSLRHSGFWKEDTSIQKETLQKESCDSQKVKNEER